MNETSTERKWGYFTGVPEKLTPVEVFTIIRHTGDFTVVQRLGSQREIKEVGDLLGREARKDDEVVIQHIKNGGRWIVLSPGERISEQRLFRTNLVTMTDIRKGVHLALESGLNRRSRDRFLGLSNSKEGFPWMMLIYGDAKHAEFWNSETPEGAAYNSKWLYNTAPFIDLARVRRIPIVEDGWT